MFLLNLAGGALLAMAGASALAQVPSMAVPDDGARPGHEPGIGVSLPRSAAAGNILEGNPRATIANTLPDPGIGEDALPADYLRAARASLLLGQTGQAQQSLEMAETGALNTTVLQGTENVPKNGPLIGRIREALQALGHGNSAETVRIIDQALAL